MSLISWSEHYNVGVSCLDEQHKGLVSLVNELYETIVNRHRADNLSEAFNALIHYTETHFVEEELMMSRAKYPNLASHKAQHQQIRMEIKRLEQRYQQGDKAAPMELLKFMNGWLCQHIMDADQAYAPYME